MDHPRTSKFNKFSPAGGTSFLILGLLLVMGFELAPMIRTRRLLVEFSKLELERASFEEAQNVAKRSHAIPYGPCDPFACEWDIKVDNSVLPRWWRGSGETFAFSFSVKMRWLLAN
jgi:hypothetical protein